MEILKHIGLSVLWGIVALIAMLGFAALFAQLGLGVIAGFLTAAALPVGIVVGLVYGLTRRP